jgi:hypothetical protein
VSPASCYLFLEPGRGEAGRISISPKWFEMVDLFSALRGMFKPIVGEGSVSTW